MRLHRLASRSTTVVAVAAFLCTAGSLAQAAMTTCSTVTACVFGNNTSSGFGVEGKSNAGIGVSGFSTKEPAVVGTSSNSYGVEGRTEASPRGFESSKAGVLGRDVTSNSDNPYNVGVAGTSTNGVGLYGSSTNGYGIQGYGNYGVYGEGSNSGVAAVSQSELGSGLFADAYYTAILAASQEVGMQLFANHQGLKIMLGTPGQGSDGIQVYTGYSGVYPANVLIGTSDFNNSYQDVVSIDGYGNEILAGTLTQNGTPLVRTHTTNGQNIATFGARTSAPSLEDNGESQLVNGQGYVRLDPAFASAIDRTSKYLVFITPQGDSKGLYVTQLSASGFAIRENQLGRSNLTFDYRIVAKPYDTKSMRLPSMKMLKDLRQNVAPPKAPKVLHPHLPHTTGA